MNLKSLSSQALHLRTKDLAQREREITLEILHHLREIDCRRYWLDLGYKDIYEYCKVELKYSGGAAHRRINAMLLLKEIPEIETKIESGELSLTNLAQVQTFFKSESKETVYSTQEKIEVLKSLENKSTREVERTLLQISPNNLPKGRERQVTEDKSIATIIIDNETKDYIEILKSLYSHKYPNLTLGELLKLLAKEAVEKKDPRRKQVRDKTATKSINIGSVKPQETKVTSRYIPASLRREVWKSNGGKCSFVSPITGKNCASTHKLEVDHIRPFALDGNNSKENLRLLCRAHNQWRAEKTFGKPWERNKTINSTSAPR